MFSNNGSSLSASADSLSATCFSWWHGGGVVLVRGMIEIRVLGVAGVRGNDVAPARATKRRPRVRGGVRAWSMGHGGWTGRMKGVRSTEYGEYEVRTPGVDENPACPNPVNPESRHAVAEPSLFRRMDNPDLSVIRRCSSFAEHSWVELKRTPTPQLERFDFRVRGIQKYVLFQRIDRRRNH